LCYLDLLDDIGLDCAALAFEKAATEPAPEARPAYLPVRTDVLLETRRTVLGPAALTYDRPLHLVRGDGVWLYGADGRRYLDAYNNVPVAGHSHPEVARKVSAQLRLLNTNSRYLHEAPVELAARLLSTAGGRLDRVLFVNSGSEANDVARRLATFATGAAGAVVTRHAYHGVTEATTELSPEGWAPGVVPRSVALVPAPAGGGAREGGGNSLGEKPASSNPTTELEHAVAELAEGGVGLGATFIDAAFTSDGILGPAPGYLQALAAATKSSGGLFVADEVQAGYGRTGGHLWSFASCGVEPDLVTVGKPMGNGFPVAAVLGHSGIVDPFITQTDYFSTFGGNTAAAVAGLAVLQVIEEEDLVANAAEVGAYLANGIGELAQRNVHLGEVRAWGLLIGVELIEQPGHPGPARALARLVADNLRERGVLVGTTGPAGDILKIRPPLVFQRCHADVLVEALDEVLAGLES
jgi:4-aminobutyrate aminotransferase-like enzyme